MSKNLGELAGRKGLTQNLFEELGIAARQTGSPSVEKMEKLADEFVMGKANVYGAASFYDFLKPENKGKKVYVCNGSSCMTAGTQDVLKEKLLKHFKQDEIGEMCCLGRCHENSSFHIAGKNYSGHAVDGIDAIKKSNSVVADKYNIASFGTAVLTSPFPGIKEYYSILADALKKPADDLLNELKISGLRGRGGAGFPIAIKLEGCKKEISKQKFIVCNADEGDPGAYSDRYLLEQQPHSVLLGMMIAGYITGADTGVVYIRGEYPEAISITQEAIKELHQQKLLGENILNSGFNFNFKVISAQGAYICGEETALLSSIEGQRPEVRVRPPYPVQQGLFNKPTVVNNVETLACIPYIIKNGGAKFASVGLGKSTGTKLISLDGYFNKPGIYEVDMGTSLSVVINDLGGGFRSKIKAMHIGGPLGGLVPVEKINDLTVDFESFSKNGFLLGHASVVCIPEDFPIIKYLEHLFAFTAHESCGKCFPCRLGSTRGAEMLKKAQESNYRIDKTLFDDLIETLEIGSLCALGGGLPLPVKNALQYFDDELSVYFKT
ncbi:MAG: NAD(P)H-dependent oxidoreductase subunit E [Sphingobacteriales bacterium]|nr:NAD(P)H-dependent oxidoreductase subunit E [Sphingobacteriales bacterium]